MIITHAHALHILGVVHSALTEAAVRAVDTVTALCVASTELCSLLGGAVAPCKLTRSATAENLVVRVQVRGVEHPLAIILCTRFWVKAVAVKEPTLTAAKGSILANVVAVARAAVPITRILLVATDRTARVIVQGAGSIFAAECIDSFAKLIVTRSHE